ncbi:MAG: hypothetical protein MUF50_01050 [Planctomycetes bacterium]|jgi:hypothetical protein|nr:hypothetical protein [Planctomycetota bacterium]
MLKNIFLTIKSQFGNKPALTILEVMISIFLLVTVMTAILTLSLQSVRSQDSSRQELIARGLAQEGIELIRNVRDSNFLNNRTWNQDIAPGQYRIDYLSFAPTAITSWSEANLQIMGSGLQQGFYLHNSSEANSIFSRVVTITSLGANSELINCEVRWTYRDKNNKYSEQTILYDWK